MKYNSSTTFHRHHKLVLRAILIVGLFFLGSGPGTDSLIAAASAQPSPQSVEFANWTLDKTARGLTELSDEKTTNSSPSLHIRSDAQSTAWAESPSFAITVPYTVTWRVWVSSGYYNGFAIYDGVDGAADKTDIRIIFHDDRGDRTAKEGWHGFVWVDDATGHYSITSVARDTWVEFTIERRSETEVNLYIDGKFIRHFVSRSESAVAEIGKLGDTWSEWWRGEAYWSPMTVSSGTSAFVAGPTASVTGTGTTAVKHSGLYTYQPENGIKAWTYAKADGIRGPTQKYSSLTAVNYKILRIDGSDGAICTGDLKIEVWYAGTIDRLSTGVSFLGGMVGDYFARVQVGVRPNTAPFDFDDGLTVSPWESRTNLFDEALMDIGTVVVGAAVGHGVGGVFGDKIATALDVGYALVEQASDVTDCDDAVDRTETIEFKDLPLVAGNEYQIYIALVSIAKAVATGVGVGYSEVDFYNREPANCDSKGSKMRTRGLQVKKVEFVCR